MKRGHGEKKSHKNRHILDYKKYISYHTHDSVECLPPIDNNSSYTDINDIIDTYLTRHYPINELSCDKTFIAGKSVSDIQLLIYEQGIIVQQLLGTASVQY